MASQSWPAGLPQNIRIPTNHQPGEQSIRTQMDAGPNKVRRRYTAVEEPFTTVMVMNGQDYQDFQNFYNTTLEGGSLRFDWENPVNDNTVEMRFTAPPQGEIISGGSATERTWRVQMELEIMP